jgi:hypothetical protein
MGYENVSSLACIYSDEKLVNYAMFSGKCPPRKMGLHCPESKFKLLEKKAQLIYLENL